MSYKCAARFCLNKYYRHKQENLTFFAFPIEEKEFCEWSDLCHRPDLKEEFVQVTTKRSQKFRLCEKHFNTNDIYNVGSKKLLKKGALPCNTIVQISSRKGDRKLEARPGCNLSPVQETNWIRISEENFNISEPDFIQITVSDILNANTNNSMIYQNLKDQEVPDVICIGFPKSESETDLVIEITEDHCLPSILELPNDCNSNLQYQKEQRIDNLQESSTSGPIMTEDKNVGVDLSQNTPRKVKLRSKLHKKTSSLSYFRRKVHDLQFFTGSNSKEEQVLQFCYKKLSEPAFEILKLQLMKNCRKYSSKVRILCLTLYYTSPLLYNVLREIFKLPSVSSLRLWTRKLNIQVGVCPRLFSVLSAKMLKVHEVDKICVLYIDEMSIKKSLEYNSRFGSILGFVDYGNGRREPKLANTALAFMVRSLHSNWKQALSFFFCENSVPFLELFKEVMFSILN
ncbi:DNA transposase THAP9 [Armadillidium vulgare]|nr:DNA transposase THAP9 [Armadillidium vulgare]